MDINPNIVVNDNNSETLPNIERKTESDGQDVNVDNRQNQTGLK